MFANFVHMDITHTNIKRISNENHHKEKRKTTTKAKNINMGNWKNPFTTRVGALE